MITMIYPFGFPISHRRSTLNEAQFSYLLQMTKLSHLFTILDASPRLLTQVSIITLPAMLEESHGSSFLLLDSDEIGFLHKK